MTIERITTAQGDIRLIDRRALDWRKGGLGLRGSTDGRALRSPFALHDARRWRYCGEWRAFPTALGAKRALNGLRRMIAAGMSPTVHSR